MPNCKRPGCEATSEVGFSWKPYCSLGCKESHRIELRILNNLNKAYAECARIAREWPGELKPFGGHSGEGLLYGTPGGAIAKLIEAAALSEKSSTQEALSSPRESGKGKDKPNHSPDCEPGNCSPECEEE